MLYSTLRSYLLSLGFEALEGWQVGRLESKGGGGSLMDCGQAGERQKSPCFRSDRLASMCISFHVIFRLLDGKQVSTVETNHKLKEGSRKGY